MAAPTHGDDRLRIVGGRARQSARACPPVALWAVALAAAALAAAAQKVEALFVPRAVSCMIDRRRTAAGGGNQSWISQQGSRS